MCGAGLALPRFEETAVYGIHAFALLCFGAWNLLAVRLCKCERPQREYALRALCAALLLMQAARYGLSWMSGGPVSVSAVLAALGIWIVQGYFLVQDALYRREERKLARLSATA